MIDLKNIFYKTKEFFLKDINHSFGENKIHAIVGPSGSGKTVLIEIIAGIRQVQKGYVLFNGQDITNVPVENRNIAYLPQDYVLFPHLSVEKNISYPLQFRRNFDYEDVYKIADHLQISHLLQRSVDHLSGGEIQRIAIARSILSNCRLLLLDEPTSALHPSMKNEFYRIIKDIQQKYQLTIILVTHDMDGAFTVSDEIHFLIHGQFYQTYINHPTTRFIPTHIEVAKFMGILNLFESQYLSSNKVYCSELSLSLETENKVPPDKEFIIGVKPEDIRIVLPHKKIEYTYVHNRMQGTIKRIFRYLYHYSILFSPKQAPQKIIEIHFPITKSNKINLFEGLEIEIYIRPNDIFILHK